jgi:Ca2+-binding EF-hand superfamily protein
MLISLRNASFLLLSITTSSAVCVQATEIPMPGPIPFEAFDKDGNKMISPQEFVEVHNQRKKMWSNANVPYGRMQRSFISFDTNGDNLISPYELNARRGGRMRQWEDMPPPWGPYDQPPMGTWRGMGQGRQMPKFTDFDLNGDGALTREEFYEARNKRWRQRAEQGYRMRNTPNAPPFERLDTDRDGKVTAEEFEAHLAMYRQMRRGRY